MFKFAVIVYFESDFYLFVTWFYFAEHKPSQCYCFTYTIDLCLSSPYWTKYMLVYPQLLFDLHTLYCGAIRPGSTILGPSVQWLIILKIRKRESTESKHTSSGRRFSNIIVSCEYLFEKFSQPVTKCNNKQNRGRNII